MIYKKLNVALFFLLLIGNAADKLTTYFGMKRGFVETNNFSVYAMDKLNFGAGIFLHFLIVFFFGVLAYFVIDHLIAVLNNVKLLGGGYH